MMRRDQARTRLLLTSLIVVAAMAGCANPEEAADDPDPFAPPPEPGVREPTHPTNETDFPADGPTTGDDMLRDSPDEEAGPAWW